MKNQSHTQQCLHGLYKAWGCYVWFVCDFRTVVVCRELDILMAGVSWETREGYGIQ